MAFEDEVREFYRQARQSAVEGASQLAARSRRAAIPRLQLAGRLGSPVQEFTFQEIERGAQEALAPQLSDIGQREATTLSELARIREQRRQAYEESLRKADEARRARKKGLLGSLAPLVGAGLGALLTAPVGGIGAGTGAAIGASLGGAAGSLYSGGQGGGDFRMPSFEDEGSYRQRLLNASAYSLQDVVKTGVSDFDVHRIARRPSFRRRLDLLPEFGFGG